MVICVQIEVVLAKIIGVFSAKFRSCDQGRSVPAKMRGENPCQLSNHFLVFRQENLFHCTGRRRTFEGDALIVPQIIRNRFDRRDHETNVRICDRSQWRRYANVGRAQFWNHKCICYRLYFSCHCQIEHVFPKESLQCKKRLDQPVACFFRASIIAESCRLLSLLTG